jgi:hypothetical protein
MSTQDLASKVAVKETEAEAARRRLVALEERLDEAERHSAAMRDLLGEKPDGRPLAMLPLYAALVGAVTANAALFFSFVVYLTRFHEAIWNLLLVISLVVGVGTVPLASMQGAGGRSRMGLRRFTIVSMVIAIAGVIVAVMTPRP